MTTKTRGVDSPPPEWIDLLDLHDEDLTRVRLLWRRGSGRYRPLVEHSADLDALERAPMADWEAVELDETHFRWTVVDGEDLDARRERILDVAQGLWRHCLRWTRNMRSRCDFQLRGFGREDEELFESGRRIEYDSPSRDRDDRPEGPSRDSAALDDGWDRLDRTKDDLIKWLVEERNTSFGMAQKASSAAPELIASTRAILERAIEYQGEQVRGLIDQSTGRTEFQARAYAERHQTHRRGMTLDFLRYAVDATLSTVVPTAKTVFETWANRSMQVFPEFKMAQQAMAYLGLTLTQPQLKSIFNDKRVAIDGFLVVLEDASRMENEREALEHLQGGANLFKSERFMNVATAEQQLAGRYIVGRLAMYRMGEYGEAAI